MSSQAAGPAPAPPASHRPWAPALRAVAAVAVAVATAAIALVEVFFVMLRVGTVRTPISIAVAVVAHPLLVRAMRDATGSRLAIVVPLAVWIATVLPFSSSRAEGDLVLTGAWVSYAYLLVGMGSFIVAIFVLAPRSRPRPAGSLGGDGAR